jgi:hypothetical protein
MKYRAAIVTGTVVLTAAVSSTIAAVTFRQPDAEKVAQTQPTQNQPTQNQPAQNQPTQATPQATTPAEQLNPPVSTTPKSETSSPRQTITLVDESVQSPEFAKFLDRTKKAVRDRDAKYIRSIVTPETRFSFGKQRSIDSLNPDNPKSPFWTSLEKSLSLGCSQEAQAYSCPTVFHQFDAAIRKSTSPQTDAFSAIVVVGQNVNVRSQPNPTAPVVATLTNEIVQYDTVAIQNASAKDRAETLKLDNPNGWTPIVLPDAKRGYVSSQFAYSPVGYRVLFGKEQGEWKMQAFVTGD